MLQTLLMMIMFAANLVHAAFTDHEEKRDLSLEAEGVETLKVGAGAGSLEVTGVDGASRIVVVALIRVPDANVDEARQLMDDQLVLRLTRDGSIAELKGYFENDGSLFGGSPEVNLEVRMPEGLSLDIEDSSGSIEVRNVRGAIDLDDGSGSIRLTDVGGRLSVRDGSGSIEIDGAGGDIEIVDGSGSITVAGVEGSVTIEDGSGGIAVSDVSGDLLIPEDGSGSLDFSKVAGRVVKDD